MPKVIFKCASETMIDYADWASAKKTAETIAKRERSSVTVTAMIDGEQKQYVAKPAGGAE